MKRSGPLTRRTGLRRTPLPRGEAKLSRTIRLRPINPERRARLQAEQYGPHASWLRTQPCAVTGQLGTDLNPVVAARTAVLPCEDCSAKGPHAAVLHADGSFTARGATCRGGAS